MPRPNIFDKLTENFQNYKERVDAYMVVNDILEHKHTSVLLSSIGPKMYVTLRVLSAPDFPSTKTYDKLCT